MQLRDHTFLGVTQSLCPECLALVPAKIVARDNGRVYFRKRCPTHGLREDYVCSDVRAYDRMEYSLPGKLPPVMGVEPDRGCPFDCGLCTEHEQHTCVGLVEITSSCNLTCPMCYAHSSPGGKHLTLDQCRAAIDRLVEVEGRPEVLQLSGGEPTIHPQFFEILAYGCAQPIDIVMVNTNGIAIARDEQFAARLAESRRRIEVYLQFDGLSDDVYRKLRGEPLLETKLRAIENLGRHDIRTTLVTTLQTDVNEDQIGAIVNFGLERPWVTGVSFQPATYSGRFVLPDQLERRITFPDVVRGVAEQTGGLFAATDFMPLPCAHPNCHSLTYAYRTADGIAPLPRFIDAQNHLEILANGITFTRPRARQLIEQYLGSLGCCGGGPCDGESGASQTQPQPPAESPVCRNGNHSEDTGSSSLLTANHPLSLLAAHRPLPSRANREEEPVLSRRYPVRPVENIAAAASDFFARALHEDLSPTDVFRITITSFLDAYNFDVRRLMKCCIHHVLPSGHVIPFCAYNVLYRDGHVPLPALRRVAEQVWQANPFADQLATSR